MQPILDKNKLMKKRIPTILGLGVLVVGLVVGVIFLGAGPGVFAPRATPETTPSKIKLTNVTDSGFTVSFFTAENTPGFIKYGTDQAAIKSQTGDDRDQLSGTIGNYQLHHITVRGLKPSTEYFYLLGTGSGASFDNNGAPFSVKTSAKGGAPSAAKTAYGNVLSSAGAPVNGAIVYLSLPEVGEMSSLTKASGGWAIPLSNARKTDGSGYATISDSDVLGIFVQGAVGGEVSNLSVSVAESQPVPDITLGQDTVASAEPAAVLDMSASVSADQTVDAFKQSLGEVAVETTSASGAAALGGLADLDTMSSESAVPVATTTAVVVLDLAEGDGQVLTTSTPTLVGKVAPNVVVSIEVNSETQITQELTADKNGYFELDIEALKKNLEPGEHSATYSYVDPTSGKTITKTVNFTVEPKQLAQASTGGAVTPYGSGNPYSMSATNAATTATKSAIATSSSTSTRSAIIATKGAVPVSGSVGTTLALMLGGMFFIMAGGWSYYLATQIEDKEL